MADDRLNIEITSNAESARKSLSNLAKEAERVGKATKGIDGKGLKNAAESAGEAAKETSTLAKEATKAKKELGTLRANIDTSSLKAASNTMQKELQSLSDTKIAPKVVIPKELENIKRKIQEATGLSNDARQRLMAKANESLKVSSPNADANSDELIIRRGQLRAQILEDALEHELELVSATKEEGKAAEDAAAKYKEKLQAYSDAAARMRELTGGARERYYAPLGRSIGVKDFLDGNNPLEGSGGADAMENAAAKSESALGRIQNALGQFKAALTSADKGIGSLSRSFAGVALKIGGNAFEGLVAGAKKAGSAVVSLAKRMASTNMKAFGKEMQFVSGATKALAVGIGVLGAKLAALPFKPLTNQLSKFGGGVKEAVGNATKTFNHGLKQVLKYAFGFRTLFYAVRALRSAVVEAFGNLAHSSEETNASLSLLSSRLEQTKNSLATAFAPILEVVTPILDRFMQYIIAALNSVGQFFATLSGKSTWQKANLQMKDYAASTDKTKKSTKEAKEATDELKKSLMGFDKINKLDDPNKSSSKSSSGNTDKDSPDYAGMFTKETVDTGISDFAKMVKKAWEDSDFTEVGKIIGEKLANALNNIPWKKIQSLAGKFGKSFATFINGLVSVKELAKALGKTIGEAINTIFTAANEFIKNIDAKKIGEFLADLMNEAVSTIKWDKIADTLATAANKKFEALATWADKFNFKALGQAIATLIYDTLSKINWDQAKEAFENLGKGLGEALNEVITPKVFGEIGETLAEALNTAIVGAHALIKEIKWDQWGESLAEAINRFFDKFDFKEAGVTFADFVNGLVDFLRSALQNTKWETVGAKLVELVKSAISHLDIGDITGLFFDTADAILKAVTGAIGAIDWKELPGKVVGGMVAMLKGVPWKNHFETVGKLIGTGFAATINLLQGLGDVLGDIGTQIKDWFVERMTKAGYSKDKTLAQNGKAIIVGIFNGIVDFFKSVGSWIKANILDPFVTGFKNTFGIHSPASEPTIVDLGKNLIEGIFNGIIDWFKGIGAWLKAHVVDPLVAAWENLTGGKSVIDVGVGLIKAGWETVMGWFKGLGEGVISVSHDILMFLKNGWGKAQDWFDKEYQKGKEAVGNAIIHLKEGWKNAQQWFETKFKEGKEAIGNAIISLKEGWKSIQDWFKTKFKEGKDAIGNAIISLKEGWKSAQDWFKSKFSEGKEAIGNAIISLKEGWTNAQNWFKQKFNEAGDVVGEAIINLKEGWKARWNSIQDWFEGMFGRDKQADGTIEMGFKSTFASVISWFTDTFCRWGTPKAGDAEVNLVSSYSSLTEWFRKKFGSWFSDPEVDVKVGFTDEYTSSIGIQQWFNWYHGSGSMPWVKVKVYYESDGGYAKAEGGVLHGKTWHKIPQYAGGAAPTHGSVFIAGEAGAEAVGHINGRTEVLNQSQMASVMYEAVARGMIEAIASTGGNTTDVHVHLDGDAQNLFKLVQREADNYSNMTGLPAFNY